MEDISFVQEALKRIHSHKGVRGTIIVSADGIPLRLMTLLSGCLLLCGRVENSSYIVQFLYRRFVLCRTTLEHEEAMQHAALATRLSSRARAAIKTLSKSKEASDMQDELLTLRVRSKKHEVIITPAYERGREFTLIVFQDPSAAHPAF